MTRPNARAELSMISQKNRRTSEQKAFNVFLINFSSLLCYNRLHKFTYINALGGYMERASACLLIVEDNPTIAELIRYALTLSGRKYKIAFAYDGVQALEEVEKLRPDLIISDVTMPRMNGYNFLQALRADGYEIPVIMLTAMARERDQIKGFALGCDDYITKPFKPSLLNCRVQAHLRKLEVHHHPVLRFADVEMDILRHTVRCGSRELQLTSREFRLLECFLRHPEEVLKRDFLLDRVWEDDAESNVVDVYIGYLRSKLEAEGAPRLIQTVRGMGYVLQTPNNFC
jgi:two-component system, OmpR family, response regulator MprA